MSATVQCAASVTTDSTGAVHCVDGTGSAVAWTVVPEFDPSMLNAADATGAFAAGFVIVGTVWAASRGIREVLLMLR